MTKGPLLVEMSACQQADIFFGPMPHFVRSAVVFVRVFVVGMTWHDIRYSVVATGKA